MILCELGSTEKVRPFAKLASAGGTRVLFSFRGSEKSPVDDVPLVQVLESTERVVDDARGLLVNQAAALVQVRVQVAWGGEAKKKRQDEKKMRNQNGQFHI
jgi:hypothetical protein